MAITFVGSTEGTFSLWGTAEPSTLSSVVVPALTDGLGLVFINMGAAIDTGGPVSGVTWNGVAMTKACDGVETANTRFTEIWYVTENDGTIDNGTYDITVSYSGVSSAACSLHLVAAWVSGVDQTTPLDDISEYDAQSGSDPSITVTPSTANQLCVASFASSSNEIVTMAATEIQRHDFGGNTVGASYDIPAGSGDKTFAYDLSNESQDWGGAGATFKEAAGATAINPSDLSSATVITDSALSAIRELGVNDLSSASQVTAAALSVLRELAVTDFSSATSITDVALTIAQSLAPQNIASESTLTAVALGVIRALGITSMSSATEITNAVLTATRALLPADIASSTEITTSTLSLIRTLQPNSLASLTEITNVTVAVVDSAISLALNNLSTASEITDVLLTKLAVLTVNDISFSTEITDSITRLAGAISNLAATDTAIRVGHLGGIGLWQ